MVFIINGLSKWFVLWLAPQNNQQLYKLGDDSI